MLRRRPHSCSRRYLSTPGAVDNTFVAKTAGSSYCAEFARQELRHRGYLEFETENRRRLSRRQNSSSAQVIPSYQRYKNGRPLHSARPPTGVDMALGMNGYHNLSDFAASAGKARTPSTLSAVNNSLPQERRRPNDPREPENWEKIKAEVEQRRRADEEERRNAVREAEEKKFQEENEELRNERSKQINSAVKKDWDYQVEFKQRREEEERQREHLAAQDIQRRVRDGEQNEMVMAKERERAYAADERDAKDELEHRKNHNEAVERVEKETERFKCETEKAAFEADAASEKRSAFEARLAVSEEQLAQARAAAEERAACRRRQVGADLRRNDANRTLREEAERVADEEKRALLEKQADFSANTDEARAEKAREEQQMEDFVRREKKSIMKGDYEREKKLELDRKETRLRFNGLVQQQIEEHKEEARRAKVAKDLAKENRLAEEERFRKAVADERERRMREQKSYADYLKDQMREVEAKRERAEEELRAFVEESRMRQNARDNQLRRRLGQINVHESNITIG